MQWEPRAHLLAKCTSDTYTNPVAIRHSPISQTSHVMPEQPQTFIPEDHCACQNSPEHLLKEIRLLWNKLIPGKGSLASSLQQR